MGRMTAPPQPPGASVSFREAGAVVWVPRAPQHPAAGTAVGQAQPETPIEPASNPNLHIPVCRASLQPLPICTCVRSVTPSRGQNPAFGLVKFHALHGECSKRQSSQILQEGRSSLKRANSTSRFGIISQLANNGFHSCLQIIDKSMER